MTGGNGMVEMGTFVAILLGNLAGGLLIAIETTGTLWVAGVCVFLALGGAAGFQGCACNACNGSTSKNRLESIYRNPA